MYTKYTSLNMAWLLFSALIIHPYDRRKCSSAKEAINRWKNIYMQLIKETTKHCRQFNKFVYNTSNFSHLTLSFLETSVYLFHSLIYFQSYTIRQLSQLFRRFQSLSYFVSRSQEHRANSKQNENRKNNKKNDDKKHEICLLLFETCTCLASSIEKFIVMSLSVASCHV